MSLELIHKNLFESTEEGIVLTIDGASKGMEGNLARNFARLHPEAWEEIEFEIKYPMPLGTARVFELPSDIECKYRYCFIASTLNHLDVLTDEEKLNVQSNAFRQVLSLGEAKGVKCLSTAIMVGGWRIELCLAFKQMISTYNRALSLSTSIPNVKLYVMAKTEYQELENYAKINYQETEFYSGHMKIA